MRERCDHTRGGSDASGNPICIKCSVPMSPKGHCQRCGAGWREYTGCEMPDCNWIEDAQNGAKP